MNPLAIVVLCMFSALIGVLAGILRRLHEPPGDLDMSGVVRRGARNGSNPRIPIPHFIDPKNEDSGQL